MTRDNKYYGALVLLFVLVMLTMKVTAGHAESTFETFFAGTDYELNVYRIKGTVPGKTLLIIGGIQGDEPGGFLSADSYADMKLAQGNLIVVPRANFYSILLNRRQINEDMNRKFSGPSKRNYEAEVVSILKQLIAESDWLLNLHDGSGFYSDTQQSDMRNPMRYGQSIIVDCETYNSHKTKEDLKLGETAREVIEEINKDISNPDLQFHLNNHRTNSEDTMHPEQRKSATYYALFECGIPAFGIETSKMVPLETRIRHHKLAINAFLKRLDIKPEVPGTFIAEPKIKYVVVKLNNQTPVVVADGETLNISKGDLIKIIHIEGNYERGLSADILGYGSINDLNKAFAITEPTEIIIKKDNERCGNIQVALLGNNPSVQTITQNPRIIYFKIRVNGSEQYYPNGAHVDLLKGDQIEIIDIGTNPESCSGVVVNFKGFVGSRRINTGEDRGYIINTGRDLWKRYSLYKMGRIYEIVAKKDDTIIIGRLFIDIKEPLFQYIVFQVGNGEKRCFFPDDTISIKHDDTIKLIDIRTNVPGNFDINSHLIGNGIRIPLYVGSSIEGKALGEKANPYNIIVSRGNSQMGFIPLKITDEKLAFKKEAKHIQ